MSFYEDLVMQTQMNYSRHYHVYASGGTPYQLSDKKQMPYQEQIQSLVHQIKTADCVRSRRSEFFILHLFSCQAAGK